MSFAAYRMMHWPTGIENCDSGFITHSRADFVPGVTSHTDDLDSDWQPRREIGPVPNLVVTAGNVLEVYVVRVQEEGGRESRSSGEVRRGGIMDGVSGASLELVCHYRYVSISFLVCQNIHAPWSSFLRAPQFLFFFFSCCVSFSTSQQKLM